MTHWDGLISASSSGRPQRICILGATNRMRDIDEAILRRMPKKFGVPLPDARQRKGIFDLVLKDTRKDTDAFDIAYLVAVSKGLSGSDIKEACRDAAMLPMREYIRRAQAEGRLKRSVRPEDIRGVRTDDFFRRGAATGSVGGSATVAGAVAKSILTPKKVETVEVVEEPEDDKAWTDASDQEEGRRV
jgi:SpoVK/Ycf46/Vps4 family AAA+-type ATPase